MRRWVASCVALTAVACGTAWASGMTADPWSPPAVLAANADANSYEVAVADDGEAVAAWAGPPGVYASAAPPGLPFGAASRLSRHGQEVLVAIDRIGDAAIAWTEGNTPRRPAGELFMTYRGAGGPFLPGRLIARRVGQFAMGMDASGNVTLVWQKIGAAGRPTGIVAMQRGANGSVGSPQPIVGSSDAYAPQVAVDRRGDAVAVWESGPVQASSIEAATRRAGHGFGTAFTVVPGRVGGMSPSVGIDDRGAGLVAWDGPFDNAPTGIPFTHIEVGVVRVAQPGITHVETLTGGARGGLFEVDPQPQVGVDRRGDAVIVWALESRGANAIEIARGRIGRGFTRATTLGRSELDQPALAAIAPSGAAAVAWDNLVGPVRVRLSTGPNAGFGASQALSASGSGSSDGSGGSVPAVAINGGRAVAVWPDTGSVQAPPPGAPQPPAGAPLLYSLAAIR